MIVFLRFLAPKIALGIFVMFAVFAGLTYVSHRAERNYLREQKIESIQKELNIRKEVNEILQQNHKSNPTRDGNIALDKLRQKYGREAN